MAAPRNLVLTGIVGYTPLNVPLLNVEVDWRLNLVSPLAPRVANSDADISNNLVTWEMIRDLSRGAYNKRLIVGDNKYYLPSPSGTGDAWTNNTVNPLAWTSRRDEPLMCGCALKEQNGNYALKEMVEFDGKIYGIDEKNNVVVRDNSDVWEHYIGAGTGWTTTHFSGNVTGATNATPIEITATGHGILTNDIVRIVGVLGNTAANGVWTITKTGTNTFTLNTSVGNGVYTAATGTWHGSAEALPGDYPTDLFAGQSILYVCSNTGATRMTTDGTTYTTLTTSNGTTQPQHICNAGTQDIGFVLWFSGQGDQKHKIIENRAGGRKFVIGNDLYRVEQLDWFSNGIFTTKRDGAYFTNPSTRITQTVFDSETRGNANGRTLVLFDERIWFNMDGHLWSWRGTGKPARETFATLEGVDTRPFYYGTVLAGHSDGQTLYVILKVTTSDATPVYQYWLVMNTGKSEWHPVLLITTTTAPWTGLPTGAYEPAGIMFEGFKLRYSMSNDSSANGRAKTGFLRTDGLSPLCSGAEFYTRNVAIRLGLFDGGKKALIKFLKELRFSLFDKGTTGKVKFYYRAYGDTVWTVIGESAVGTQDNTTLAIPTSTNDQIGITVANYFELKVELTNSSASPAQAWWLSDLYLVGLAHTASVNQGTFQVWLPDNGGDASEMSAAGYDSDALEAALYAGIAQAKPITLQHPTKPGTSYKVKLRNATELLEQVPIDPKDTASSVRVHRKLAVQWIEMN